MNILLTGSASHLARATLPLLLEHPNIQRVVGIDIKPSGFENPRFEEHRLDIRSPAIAPLFDNIDCVIHMAFVVMRGTLGRQRHDRTLMRDTNVNGSINVFNQAASHGVPSVLHLSSAAVYGPHPDTPPQVSEQQPLRALPGFAYAEDKVEVEHWLTQWQCRNPVRVVRLRPHAILGRHAQPLLKRILYFPIIPRITDNPPQLQCVWENDVARAILLAIFSDISGSFNISTQESLPFVDMHNYLKARSLALPYAALRQAHRLAWHITGRYGEPGWLQALQYPLTLDIRKAARMLEWHPSRNLTQCLDLMRREPWVM